MKPSRSYHLSQEASDMRQRLHQPAPAAQTHPAPQRSLRWMLLLLLALAGSAILLLGSHG